MFLVFMTAFAVCKYAICLNHNAFLKSSESGNTLFLYLKQCVSTVETLCSRHRNLLETLLDGDKRTVWIGWKYSLVGVQQAY